MRRNIKKLENYGSEDDPVTIDTFLDENGDVSIFYEGAIASTIFNGLSSELSSIGEYNNARLFLTSGGGDTAHINCFPFIAKKLRINEVYGVGQVSSAALAILLQCKKHGIETYIDKLCHVMLHRVSTTWVAEERSERIIDFTEKWVSSFEKIFDGINAPLIRKLPADQKKAYKDGNNVYLLGDDLIQMGIIKEFDKKSL